MFEYVLYDRALFNLNTWPKMTITPRHGRQFCEARFEKTELYSEKDKFTHDAEKEYGHVSNALLLLRLGKRCVLQFYEMFYRNIVVSKIFCSKASFHNVKESSKHISLVTVATREFTFIISRSPKQSLSFPMSRTLNMVVRHVKLMVR